MVSLRRYTASDAPQWDRFVEDSKNGTFLFLRGYMDYHSDRFTDHSLMFYDERQRLIALLPANEKDGILYSHQGLTYGGLVMSEKNRTAEVLEIFSTAKAYLKVNGFKKWYYKQMPTCYHQCPSEEDEYALWRSGAKLESCLISTTISLNGCTIYPEIERRRKRGVTKAEEVGYTIKESTDYEQFWRIMEANLMDRYSLKPVHTLQEMLLLHSRFPKNIRLFLVTKDGKAEGGCVVYVANNTCIHIQYGHATPQGKQDGVLDLLYTTLMDEFRKEGYRYMDFGNSNEQGGKYLNENLIAQKEGFGGRGTVYKQWVITI